MSHRICLSSRRVPRLSTRKLVAFPLLALALWLTQGCGHGRPLVERHLQVAANAQFDTGCSSMRTVRYLKNEGTVRFQLVGCGRQVVYLCQHNHDGNMICQPTGAPRKLNGEALADEVQRAVDIERKQLAWEEQIRRM